METLRLGWQRSHPRLLLALARQHGSALLAPHLLATVLALLPLLAPGLLNLLIDSGTHQTVPSLVLLGSIDRVVNERKALKKHPLVSQELTVDEQTIQKPTELRPPPKCVLNP